MQLIQKSWEGNLTAQNARKPFGGRGSAPDPAGELTALPQTPYLVGGAGCPLPKNPFPRSRPFGPRLSYPHSKISSDAVADTQK